MITPSTLPIHDALPELLAALRAHRNVVLQAPPGAGKSTWVPLALLQSALFTGRILMLEPRRIAARSVAMRMASTLNEPVGLTVGYRTRLDTRVSATTRIEVVTEGILTRMLQHDAALEDVSLVIFDEFHERSLQADLGLALCLDAQSALRDDLKLLVMSATLDGAAVATLLGTDEGSAPIITSAGQSFAVNTIYRHAQTSGRLLWNDHDIARDVSNVILRALDADHGDLLVFLPGQGEIRRVQNLLAEAALPAGVDVLPLFGELQAEEQDRAIAPAVPGRRKVVLATNIAETSLTIDGVRVVIDSGLERRARFDPVSGMSALQTLRISRASSDQRRGRAGRTQNGVCYRLWLESEQAQLNAHTPAEILEADLAALALELACWGVSDAASLRWLDVPPAASVAQARDLLRLLGALDAAGRITSHGRAMVQLGAPPRLAHLLLRARELGLAALGAELAALLSERDVIRARGPQRDADLRSRLEALRGTGRMEIDHAAKQRVQRSAQLYLKQLQVKSANKASPHDDDVGRLLAFAYPDRIARTRGEGGRYLLANGRGAVIQGPQTFSQSEYLVIAQLDAGDREARIQLAAPITLAQLEQDFADIIQQRERIEWDSREGAVVARRERLLGALPLDSQRLDKPDPGKVLAAMLEGIRETGLAALPWNATARALHTRMLFAQQHDTRSARPWPHVDEPSLLAHLDEWLAPWLDGLTRRSQWAQLDLHQALLSLLDWDQQQRLNEVAPTHLPVPSGSRIPLDYSGPTPTLSVRLQEVFGMTETPRVGGGEVPVLMELLSPARRPVQVTQDLRSFWARGYHDVKKDLKGRYPKHYWPDDPLQAEATARAKPRGT